MTPAVKCAYSFLKQNSSSKSRRGYFILFYISLASKTEIGIKSNKKKIMVNEKWSIIKIRKREEFERLTAENYQIVALQWILTQRHNTQLIFKQMAHYYSYRLIPLLIIPLTAHKTQ